MLTLSLSSTQAKEKPLEDVVIHVNKQLSRYIQPPHQGVSNIINHVNGELVKTSVNKMNELVFILAGQSNMSGYGTMSKLPAAYRRTPSNVTFYFNGYPAKMNRFARFGPEISFAHAIARRFPHKKIKLIKFAVGGTSLFAWAPHWRLDKARKTRNASAGPLFEKLIKTIRRHSSVKGVKFAGILWMQGETDARYSSSARTYSRNLVQFVRALRRELRSPSLAFFMGQVDPPITAFPYREMVRKAQKNSIAGIRNSRLISTKGLKKRSDNLHYNTAGQIALGLRFAGAFIQAATHTR
ncbi:MAG: sialate O-acetylesterase [Cocleimonas sp.]|nr:sialate O-acetylesterase [Cocleimonas sp.]